MRKELKELTRDTKALCRFLFKIDGDPVELSPYQEEFISAVVWKKHKRLILWCSTQAGKSSSIAMAILLTAMLRRNERIVNVSLTNRQAGIIFQYVKEHIFDHPWITKSILAYSSIKRDKFLAKLNREEISFKADNILRILSAESGNPPGEGLLGFSATTLIIDESPSVPDAIYRTKILRMLGAKKSKVKKVLIEAGTGFSRNHFWHSWNDPDYHQILVDWERAVREDRLDYDFVMKQKETLSQDEFDIWYNCKLPAHTQGEFVPWAQIERAKLKYVSIMDKYKNVVEDLPGTRLLGIDPAGAGSDTCVLTSVAKSDIAVMYHSRKFETSNTGDIVSEAILQDKRTKYKQIKVDAGGLGQGVYDILSETEDQRNKVFKLLSQASASTEKNKLRFFNLKAEMRQNLRKLFEDDKIAIPNDLKLIKQLTETKVSFTSKVLMFVDYKGVGSPDELDALCYACYEPQATKQTFWLPLSA